MRRLADRSVDLVYIDPPFGTGRRRRLEAIRTGTGDRTRLGFGGRLYRYDVVSSHEYDDGMALDDYLTFLYDRFVEMHRLLTETGSMYVHLDFRTVHHARFMLDEVFGSDRLHQRDHLGVRLRRPAPRSMASQARQHPLVREVRPMGLQPRGDRSDPLHGARSRRPRQGGPGQAPDGHVVDDDRSHRRTRAHRVPHAEAGGPRRAHRPRLEPPGRPRCRFLLRQRHDRRGRASCRATLPARRQQSRGHPHHARAAPSGDRAIEGESPLHLEGQAAPEGGGDRNGG